jgi:hypothetical protein
MIPPGDFYEVVGAADPEALLEYNFEIASRLLYMREAREIDGVPVTTAGPPTDYRMLKEFWRDVHGAEYVCTAEGDPETETPDTWKQIRPAVVTSTPSGTIPTGYWIVRADLDFKHYRYDGSSFVEMFLSLSGGTMTGALTLSGTPSSSLHAATKAYVDALAGGTDLKESCRLATTANVNLATTALSAIDGVTPVDGDRVLVMNQTAAAENGIYIAHTGSWTRALDADVSDLVTAGMYCFVTEGTVNGDKGFVLTTNDPITLDTTALTFTQFSKGLSDGECTDAKIGDRTVNQSLASPADTGDLTELFSWLAGRIKGITGKSDWKTAPQTDLEKASVVSLNFVIDGGGSVITTGLKGFLEISFGMTITGITVLADQTGSAVIDIWKDTYANYPPTVADTITASAKPTLSSAVKTKDTTLTGWTTSVSAGDILAFNVDSITTIQRLTISITGKKTA